MSNEALFSDGQSTSGNIVSENLNQGLYLKKYTLKPANWNIY